MHRVWRRTWRTETSQYPEEKKETSIPLVAASEDGTAQTPIRRGVVGTNIPVKWRSNGLERPTIEGDSPVAQSGRRVGVPE